MTFNYFLHVVLKRWKWIVLIPLLSAFCVYSLYKRKPMQYASKMTVYTGLSSGVSIQSEGSANNSKSELAYENLLSIIKSDKSLETVGLSLFANVLINGEKNDEYITASTYNSVKDQIPPDVKKLVDRKSFELTRSNLQKYLKKNNDNYLYNLIYKSSSPFSISNLASIEAKRIRTSDLLEVSFVSADPALCYQTLVQIYEVAIMNYKSVKTAQSNDVVDFFKVQLDSTSKRLAGLEDEYVSYNQNNKIINFQEQSKQVVAQKLDMDIRFDNISMQMEGATKIIAEMESKMGLQNKLKLKNAEILYLRSRIGKLAAENAMQSALSFDSVKVVIANKSFNSDLTSLRSRFTQVLDSINLMKNTAEGISIDQILSKWLESVIEYETAKAQLPVLEKRAQLINEVYDELAPMGATVKRKERSIDVTEKEYLSLIQSLSSSKMREQNDEISANAIKMMDEPYFPFSALPDKSKFMAIVAALAIFILLLAFILLTEYFDSTLGNPERSYRLMKQRVKLLFPVVVPKKKFDHELIGSVAARIVSLEILRLISSSTPGRINLISIRNKEGKTFLSECIKGQIVKISQESQNKQLAEIKVEEIPALLDNYVDADVIREADINILICRANRSWKKDDERVLKNFREKTGIEPIVMLNGVSLDVFESAFGELPIPRSKSRKFLKRLLHVDFNSKDKF